MKYFINTLTTFLLVLTSAIVSSTNLLSASEQPSEVILRPQTPLEAFSFIEYLANKLPWFKDNGYNIDLPSHPKFEFLHTNIQVLSEGEKEELKQVFITEVYHKTSFDMALSNLHDAEPVTRKGLDLLSVLAKNWDFHLKQQYNIVLTLYGPGGNYNVTEGRILVKIKENKEIPKKWIEKTILHEIVHIGIEESIVQKFNLLHWEKERLVDLICFYHLKEILPDYQMQEKGDTRIDTYINEFIIIHDLPSAISNFVKKHPRQ